MREYLSNILIASQWFYTNSLSSRQPAARPPPRQLLDVRSVLGRAPRHLGPKRHPAPSTFLQDFKLTWCPAGGWWRVSPWLRSDETAQSGLLLIRRIVNSLNCQDFCAISEWVWSKEARTRPLHTYHHHILQLAYLNLKWEADWKQTWQLTKGGKYIFQSILSFVVLPSSILDILIPSIFLASWIALFLLGALPPATTDCISESLNRNLTVDSV